MTKDEILERYLNTVYLGNGAYGVQAGAETYFGVGVAELDVAQSAFLAGLIANPSRFDPDPRARRRRWPGATSRSGGWSPEGHLTDEAADYIDGLRRSPTAINQVNPETQDYFVEEVKQALFDDPRLGATREERQNRVFRGGLRIYTTLDPRAQAMATTRPQRRARRDRARRARPPGSCPLAPDPTSPASPATPPARSCRSSRAPARCGPWSAAPGSRARSSTSPPRASAARAGPRSRSSCSWRCWRTATSPPTA